MYKGDYLLSLSIFFIFSFFLLKYLYMCASMVVVQRLSLSDLYEKVLKGLSSTLLDKHETIEILFCLISVIRSKICLFIYLLPQC